MNHDPQQRKLGKSMLWAFWVIVLICLVFFFGHIERKQINPNQQIIGSSSDTARTIELQQNKAGHYVASGLINHKPVVFLLDTGATDVAVPANIAKTLQLIQGRSIRIHTANGVSDAHETHIPSLSIGNITLENVSATITPNMAGNQILLGMSALRQIDFSQNGNVLTLTQTLSH